VLSLPTPMLQIKKVFAALFSKSGFLLIALQRVQAVV
jgi:hypothetical protein